jgi:hypothetical protein
MSQLMGEEHAAPLGVWSILAPSKNNVATHRVGAGAYSLRRLDRARVGMDSHGGKIVAKALVHFLP